MFSTIAGRVLSHYEVGGLIGKGGMGHVYNGYDVRLNRPVAIKVLPHWARGDPRARQRLLKEACAAAAVNHPHIVTVYEIGQHQGVDLMVMEFVPGKTHDESIPRRGLPVPKAVALALQIGDALNAAHSASILHRDLKPSNVMVTEDGRLKLLDFGLAESLGVKARRAHERGKPHQPGTRVYMSPEQLKGQRGDVRSEIFSFGLVLHQMLSGGHPFEARTSAIVTRRIKTKPAAALPPKVPRNVARVVERCLEKAPRQRFQSMPEVLDALGEQAKKLAGGGLVPQKAASADGSGKLRPIRAAIKRIVYTNVGQSRSALAELSRLVSVGASPTICEAVVADLKSLILTLDDYADGVPDSVREVRKAVLDVMKTTARGDLAPHFRNRELEFLDLFEMNFEACQLTGVSFRKCFLAGAICPRSHLASTSFAGAFIRNVDFAGADLSTADFSYTDWFNALNLTKKQLACVRQGTLRECPPDIQAMHDHLKHRYGRSFQSWTTEVQDQLNFTWNEYLRPGGLRDLVAGWQRAIN